MKLINRTFGVLSVLILTIGLTQLFNQILFLVCFGLGLLSTVFYLLTAHLNSKYNEL